MVRERLQRSLSNSPPRQTPRTSTATEASVAAISRFSSARGVRVKAAPRILTVTAMLAHLISQLF
jgi:hypothetical protein